MADKRYPNPSGFEGRMLQMFLKKLGDTKGSGQIEHKDFTAEVKAFDDEKLIVEHFISTERRDRGGDILYAGKNEKGRGMLVDGKVVVLHSHGFHPLYGTEPIGKPIAIRVSTFKGYPGIEVKTQFFDGSHLTPPDNTGRRLYDKCKHSYLVNWSIGWRPLISEYKDDRNGEMTRHVYEWELLEYSPVGVPMNPDAQTPEGKTILAWKAFHVETNAPRKARPTPKNLLAVPVFNRAGKKVIQLPNEFFARIASDARKILEAQLRRARGSVE